MSGYGETKRIAHQTEETSMTNDDTTFTSEEFDTDGIFHLALSATDYETVMQALADRAWQRSLEPDTARAQILGQRLQDWNHTDVWANA
jgi:hypothetical protein